MLKVTDDVTKLKLDAERQDIALKTNQKIQFLESTLEWFKKESLQLTDKNAAQKKEIEKWKGKAQVLESDIKFLQSMIKKTKKTIKTLNYRISQCTCKHIKGEIDDPSIYKEMSSTSHIRPSLLSPKDHKYDDTTMIFDKTQSEYRNKDSMMQGTLMLRNTQSNDQSLAQFTEANEFIKQIEHRSSKVILQQKRQIEHLKKKLNGLTGIKVKTISQSSELERIFMD